MLRIASGLAIFAVSAAASLSVTTDVYWNAKETSAWPESIGTGPSSAEFHVMAWIESSSTHQIRYANANSNYTTSDTATTTAVSVTYPSPIPLVYYGGSIEYGHWEEN